VFWFSDKLFLWHYASKMCLNNAYTSSLCGLTNSYFCKWKDCSTVFLGMSDQLLKKNNFFAINVLKVFYSKECLPQSRFCRFAYKLILPCTFLYNLLNKISFSKQLKKKHRKEYLKKTNKKMELYVSDWSSSLLAKREWWTFDFNRRFFVALKVPLE